MKNFKNKPKKPLKRKNILFSLLLVFFLPAIISSSCNNPQSNSFSVHGTILGLSNAKVFLKWIDKDTVYIDSTISNDGNFTFTGMVSNPTAARLRVEDVKENKKFQLENSEIRINGSVDSLMKAKVTGSQSQDNYQGYKDSIQFIKNQQDTLYVSYVEAQKKKDVDAMNTLDKLRDSLWKERDGLTKRFISKNPKSLVSLKFLGNILQVVHASELKRLFNGLDSSLIKSRKGNKLLQEIIIRGKTEIGEIAPDFTQNDANGNLVSLLDFRGKFVLIDFWASWCAPCRVENPNVVKAFNKYKSRNFTVLGVSLDGKEDRWKDAIEQDNLQWTQVSDLKGWGNKVAQQYGVHAIPTNWLIDPDGKIIGRNLRGKALNNKLKEILE